MSPIGKKELKCFAIRRGEIEHRLDCQFYLPEHRYLKEQIRHSSYPVFRLGDPEISQKIVDGPFGSQLKVEEYKKSGIPLIRVANCRDGEIRTKGLVYISEEKHQQLIRSEVLPGDVLLTKAGVLGDASVFPNYLKKGNITSHLASIQPTNDVVPDFLATYLSSTFGIKQIYRWGNKTTRPELNTDEVREILIIVPPTAVQKKLVGEMKAAREDRRKKLQQADELFSSLDEWLMDKLGLTMPFMNERMVFAVTSSQINSSHRLNPDYFHPERLKAIGVIKSAEKNLHPARLADFVEFRRDVCESASEKYYLGLAHIQSHTGEVIETNEEAEGQCFSFQENDVLFARLRPYLNKVYCAERVGVCSTEFHVIRVKKSIKVLPDYLAVMLRSRLILAQTRHMMTGNTHPRLTNDDVVNLIVPIPSLKMQQVIATEIRRRREEARRLKTDAESEWENAKMSFEEKLLEERKKGTGFLIA